MGPQKGGSYEEGHVQQTGFRATALRYRPQTFAGLIGQEHVSQTLINAIKSGRVAHSYLFSGPRGVGKTSAARILAKSLNCEHGPTDSPCGVCTNCVEIAESRSLDVYEIDGASNRGIEQIRDLRESVRFTPARSRYKIYIIDEVHMLTNEAFNALLKTLEEPPPYIVFIFATTEAAKVKITIRSRCQHYRFKRIQTREIQARLRAVCDADGIPAEDEALFLIARAADGSMRDSQSLFDQVASYALDGITAAHAREIIGSIDTAAYFDFLTFLLERDSAELLSRIAVMDDEGVDFGAFAQGLVEMLRNLVLLASGADEQSLELTPEDCNDLRSFVDPSSSDGFSLDDAVILLNILADLMAEMHDARNPRRVFEMAVFRLVNFRNMVRPEDVLRRIEELERRLRGGASVPERAGEVTRKPGPVMPIEIAGVSRPKPVAHAHAGAAKPEAEIAPEPLRPEAVPPTEPPAVTGSIPEQPVPPAEVVPPAVPPLEGATHHGQALQAQGAVSHTDCLALVRELAREQDGPNPFLARVLNEIVRAEIVGSILVFWLLPKSRFHRSSIESSYSETILAFFAARLGVSLRLECRFTDEGSRPPAVAPVRSAPQQTAPVRAETPSVPESHAASVTAPVRSAPQQTAPVRAETPSVPESRVASVTAPVRSAPQQMVPVRAGTPTALENRAASVTAPVRSVSQQTAPAAAVAGGAARPVQDMVEAVRTSFGGTVLFDESAADDEAGLATGEWGEDESLDENFSAE